MISKVGSTALFTKNQLRFRARLPDRWIDGTVTTVHQRVGDLLNQEGGGGGMILVEDFRLDGRPTESPEESSGYASLNLAQVRFVIPVEEGDPPPPNAFEWVQKRPNLVRVGTAGFDVVGDLYISDAQSLRDVILRQSPPFLVLTTARLQHRESGASEDHRAIFVNRKLAEFIRPEG